jgi:predicted permease
MVRAAVAEGTLVALAGGVLGVLLARVAVRGLVSLAPPGIPRLAEVALDARGLGVALLVSLAAGVVMGVFPLPREPLALGTLREGGRGQTASRGDHALRGGLVTAQVAVALVLLAAAGLMLRSFDRLRAVDPGFDPRGVTVLELSLPRTGYTDYASVNRFYRTLAEQVSALPGVASVGAVSRLPMQGAGCSLLFVEGKPVPPAAEAPCIEHVTAAPGYFRSMGIPVRGQAPGWEENERGAASVVVTRALAERLWPGEDPIGKGVRGMDDEPPYFRVTGVTGDIRGEGLDKAPVEAVFYPMTHAKGLVLWNPPRAMTLVVRTHGGQPPLAAVRSVLRGLDPEVPVGKVQSMDAVVAASPSVARTSFTLMLLATGGGMALLLSVVGLYGVGVVLGGGSAPASWGSAWRWARAARTWRRW